MELGAHSVHVWLTRLADVPASALDGYRGLMSRDELARNRRYKSGPLRDANTVTRALLRTVLSQYDDHAPARWEFAAGEHGRPFISEPATGLHFNLSHSTEWVACAVARIPAIGIDVERCGRDVDVVRLASRFFSPREYRDLLARPDADRKARFFDYWTLKESYIKARGEGISLGLDKFSFRFAADGHITIECDEQLRDDPVAWHFRLSGSDGDHRLALAVKPPHPAPVIGIRHFLTIPRLGVEDYTGPLRLLAPA